MPETTDVMPDAETAVPEAVPDADAVAALTAERGAAQGRCGALATRCAALEQRRGSAQAGANPPGGGAPPQRPLLGAELARMRREQLGRYRRG